MSKTDGILKSLTRFAQQGNSQAQFELGSKYYRLGKAHNFKLASYWWKKAALQGHSSAQNNLGVCYKNGQGVKQDYTKAVYWWEKAALQGYASAQYNLGTSYLFGRGVEKDCKQTIFWWTKTAKQGDFIAQYYLGELYENGIGVEQDYKMAYEWLKKSYDGGYKKAKDDLDRVGKLLSGS